MRMFLMAALLMAAPAVAQTPVRSLPPDGFKFMSHQDIDKAVSVPEAGRL